MTKAIKVHISEIKQGDTVLIDGNMITVGKHHVSNGFTGWCFESNPHRETNGFIDVVLFPKWHKNEIVSYVKQI